VEADEYDRSFLTLAPNIAIVTSMDADHLDVYGEHSYLTESFEKYVSKLPSDGILIKRKGLSVKHNNTIEYAVNENADYYATNINIENGEYHFDVITPKERLKDVVLGMPGLHNVENAVAAIIVGMELGISTSLIVAALKSFKGVKRRFEYHVKTESVVYIDDYAHHPVELKACINSVKEMYPAKKITGVFQPHLYSRTRDFADDFAVSLDLLDEVLLLDIYPARELPIEGVSSLMLLSKVSNSCKELLSKDELVESITDRKLEVLLTLGAGDIDELIEPIKKRLMAKKSLAI
jgi:UDP-N-acetylmuramate--alanine ligase